jgi:hypothetical protein
MSPGLPSRPVRPRCRPAQYVVALVEGRWRVASHGVKAGCFDDEAAAVALAEKLAREAAHLGRWARVAVVSDTGWSECRLFTRRELGGEKGHVLATRVRRFRGPRRLAA